MQKQRAAIGFGVLALALAAISGGQGLTATKAAAATSDPISFGTPTDKSRMPGATSDAPPEPPAEMMPATLPCRRSHFAKASAIAVMTPPGQTAFTLMPSGPSCIASDCVTLMTPALDAE